MSEASKLIATITAIVRAALTRVDLFALYGCKVIGQNGDGSLELQPDDPRIPGASQVPIRYGIPGVRVEVAAGSRVMLGWENGDPMVPFAALWNPEGCKLIILGDGSRPVARQGDPVQVIVKIPGVVPAGLPCYGTILAGATKVKA